MHVVIGRSVAALTPRLQLSNFLQNQPSSQCFMPVSPIAHLRQLLFRIDGQPEQAACNQHRGYYVHRVIETVCGLYDVPEDEGEEEGAHLPEKVHRAGYRACVVAETKSGRK